MSIAHFFEHINTHCLQWQYLRHKIWNNITSNMFFQLKTKHLFRSMNWLYIVIYRVSEHFTHRYVSIECKTLENVYLCIDFSAWRGLYRRIPVSYTHLRAHETSLHLVCRLLVEKNFFFFLMIRRPPRSTHCISSAASDVYKRQGRG